MNLIEFWSQCLTLLREDLSEQQFNLAIAPLTVGEENGKWVIYTKNQFNWRMVSTQFAKKIDEARHMIAPDVAPLTIKIGKGQTVVAETLPKIPKTPIQQSNLFEDLEIPPSVPAKKRNAQEILADRIKEIQESNQNKPPKKTTNQDSNTSEPSQTNHSTKNNRQHTNLSSIYTFESLIVGKSNRMAVDMAKNILENLGNSNYNPFIIYGSTGLGKTHLAQAIGNSLSSDYIVHYTSIAEFTRKYTSATRTNEAHKFNYEYLKCHLLIFDDIQNLQGKIKTAEQFLNIFEYFQTHNKQLILIADQPPQDLAIEDKRLQSRLNSGIRTEIEPPDFELRHKIVVTKAQDVGFQIHEDASLLIAKHIKRSARELEGAINQIMAHGNFGRYKVIDRTIAERMLREKKYIKSSTPDTIISAETIIRIVADFYQIKPNDITGKNRNRQFARPRQMAMALVKEYTVLSFPSIGKAFGGKDHSTVIHGVKNIKKLIEEDNAIGNQYNKLQILIDP